VVARNTINIRELDNRHSSMPPATSHTTGEMSDIDACSHSMLTTAADMLAYRRQGMHGRRLNINLHGQPILLQCWLLLPTIGKWGRGLSYTVCT
jgi:hypothetical protein